MRPCCADRDSTAQAPNAVFEVLGITAIGETVHRGERVGGLVQCVEDVLPVGSMPLPTSGRTSDPLAAGPPADHRV